MNRTDLARAALAAVSLGLAGPATATLNTPLPRVTGSFDTAQYFSDDMRRNSVVLSHDEVSYNSLHIADSATVALSTYRYDAQIGALKVATGSYGPPGLVADDWRSLGSNNGVAMQASASWTDVLTLSAPAGVTSGHFTGRLIVVGSLDLTQASPPRTPIFALADARVQLSATSVRGPVVDWRRTLVSNDLPSGQTTGQASTGPIREVLSFDIPFTDLAPLALTNSVSCRTEALTFFSSQSVVTDCSLGNSVYWGGITAAYDQAGRAIAGFGATGSDGFDYRHASPLAPAGSVPEPASWAMLVAGFGMVGAATRRRRVLAGG